ncbi:LysM peptidoglycan-binding domain-containing protein [Streptomyces sp. NPDC048257]|uniref:LysM peptidoglycan-binding domain-containing protein n=1 Tax=Streptomyces sp. NPDC048257 TaxID=3365526 RepID=UPI0037172986
MGLFDFLKYDKKKAHGAAEKTKEQVQQQTGETRTPSASSAADAASATRAAAERMAAAAPPRPAPATPTPTSAAHKAVPALPKLTPMPKPAASSSAAPGAMHTPTPHSAAHKAVPAAPMSRPGAAAAKRTYTVRPGDSLAAIARRELGNEARWRELYALNEGVVGSNPDLVRPGTVLTLPG